jgi:SAM-dependent methyltransferase
VSGADRSSCPACGDVVAPWRWIPVSEPALGDLRYPLRRCRRCGSAVTIGTTPHEAYESGAYRPGEPRLSRGVGPLLRAFARERLALLGELVSPPARVLDAGAGRGRFVAAARAAGYDAFGVEPSARGASAAASLGVPVQRASIEAAEIEERSLDAITLWHVLEHLDSPAEAIEASARWLRPGGALLVGVPNLASLQARIAGAGWYHFDVPRHRVHFTPDGVHTLLTDRGFAIVRTAHVVLEHNTFGMWQSLLNRATRNPSYLYNLLKRNAPAASRDLLVSAIGAGLLPAAAIAELLAGLARRGGTIVVLARHGSVPQ